MVPWKSWKDVEMVSKAEFEAGRRVRYPITNGELMDVPFWKMMVRWGANAYSARTHYGAKFSQNDPIWCFDRFGMTTTLYENRFVISIGGEHEDFYDPDFQIYNDVIVRDLNGNVWIYGYPKSVFPPTDFHTATLIGELDEPWSMANSIVVIGGLGYTGEREFWRTPVYRLELDTMHMHELEIGGNGPGWIFQHSAAVVGPGLISVFGGQRVVEDNNGSVPNDRPAVLNLMTLRWE